jgi:heat-inducible transcriptional repressor
MSKRVIIPQDDFSGRRLSERERDILRTIIHMYILNAAPIGSRALSKYLQNELKLSPATIRNVMSDLEEMEFITHPHTSAGRVPTDKGYRYYVDTLMHNEKLTPGEIKKVNENLENSEPAEAETVLRDTSKMLGFLSNCLAVVEIPHLIDLKVEKIELVSLSSTRLLVVIALDSQIVRTVTIEADFEVDRREIDRISELINERISGKPLKYLEKNFSEIISDSTYAKTPLVRLFVDSIDKVFSPNYYRERLHISGTQNLLENPEFEDVNRVRSVIELVENEDVIVHVLDKNEKLTGDLKILIGREMNNKLLADYSLISTKYCIGSATGSIGLIGPKRMNYSHLTSLIQYVGKKISEKNS